MLFGSSLSTQDNEKTYRMRNYTDGWIRHQVCGVRPIMWVGGAAGFFQSS